MPPLPFDTSVADVRVFLTLGYQARCMKLHDISIQVPDPLLEAAKRLAASRDVTVGQVFRAALSNEIRRSTRNAKTPNRADEQLLAPLRALLAVDFGRTTGWEDLQSRLQSKGYTLREGGGGLAIHSYPDGVRLCKASELGHAYSSLMRRFQRPFPGHSHQHLVNRIIPQYAGSDPEDIDLIEPF